MPKPIHWCASEKQRGSGLAQRTAESVDRHEPVARERVGRCGRGRRGDGVALHAVRKLQLGARVTLLREAVAPLPVLVEHITEA